jgi:hypothetical protein
MTTYSGLIDDLRRKLVEYKYTEFQEIPMANGGTLHAIMTPRRWMVRYVCAVYEIPTGVTNATMLTEVFNLIRRQLFVQYARFPYWKELGTFLVLLCSHEQYEQLAVHTDEFKDHSGLHGNVMLGTMLIDHERFQSSADATWGLYYSGKHFTAIARAVREWCKAKSTDSEREVPIVVQ